MSKFTLLTTLTLSAAGFDKGVDKAKKSTKALADGVKTAGSTMAGAFSPLKGILGDLGGQLGGVADVATGGVSAFKKMIPAISGIKTALISTGIGAIVVALGTAFAALMSYLKGTEDGASKLNKVMAVAKGVFNAILVRVQLLGEAISLVFEGKFKQAGEKLKEAFSGGLLEEIKSDVKDMTGLAERENKLWKERLDWGYKEIDLLAEVNRLRLIGDDKSKSLEERQKAINSAIAIQKRVSNENNRLATEEYEILKTKNALGNNSRADSEAELELYRKAVQVRADESNKLKEMVVKQNELKAQVSAQVTIQRELPIAAVSTADAFKGVSLAVSTIDSTKLVQMKEQVEAIKQPLLDMQNIIGQVLPNAVVGLTSAFGNLFAGTESGFKDIVTTALKGIQQIINAMLAEAIAGMIAGEAKKGIVGLITASIGIGALLALWESKVPKFAKGGIVSSPTLAMVGEYPNAHSNPEVITPLSKLREMIGGAGTGEVVFRIDGTQLIGVLNNNSRRTNSYR